MGTSIASHDVEKEQVEANQIELGRDNLVYEEESPRVTLKTWFVVLVSVKPRMVGNTYSQLRSSPGAMDFPSCPSRPWLL